MAIRLTAAALMLGLCAATLPAAATAIRPARAQSGSGVTTPPHNDPLAHKHTAAMLESCVAASTAQTGGTAMFAAQMTSLPGTYELEMRFEILEHQPGQPAFHRPLGTGAPGLGSWRVSGPHVAILKDFDEVTNLAGPALYKVRVRYRWLDAEGHPIHWAERETEPCKQSAAVTQTG
jgi:hypothetical protein